MESGVVRIFPATPAFPDAPIPTGQLIDLPTTLEFHPGFARWRSLVQTKVVPLLSDRCTTVIVELGKVTPGFSAEMFAWFHLVILPRKISPSTWPVRLRPDERLATLYAAVTAPIVSGMCSNPGAAARSLGLSGASEPAKSTVFAVIAWIPAPLPPPWSFTC